METEVIDKLFLELSQVTKATTKRELDLQAKIEAMSLPDEVVDLRLLMDCRKELRNERKERRDERLKKYAENRDFAYDAIDRYLRNNMDDEGYALFSAHLDALYAIPSDAEAEDRFPQEKTDDRREALRISKLLLKKDAEIERLRNALHQISLCSQNSMSSKEECGRIARAALAKEEDKP
jgi:hypothetical protein